MVDTKNLYQRLLDITEEVGKIDKTGRNTQQGYAFIEQAQVVAEVRTAMVKHGVMIMPEITDRKIDRFDVTRSSGKAGVDIHATVKSRYTVINADNPDERFTCAWDGGEAIDSSDKATNKAGTASHKYFLMKLFNISDKDDPDTHTPELPRSVSRPASDEPISSDTYTKLLTGMKFKGITDKDQAIRLVDHLSNDLFNIRAVDMTEGQAKALSARLAPFPAEELQRLLSDPF